MRVSFYSFVTISGLIIGLWACMEIHPLSPPKEPDSWLGGNGVCQVPPIETNIIGTWHFESNIATQHSSKTGTVTFDAKGNIADPDSLFENMLDVGPVVSKTYNSTFVSPFPNFPGTLFLVTLNTKQTKVTNYFTLVSNECNRVHIRLFDSRDNIVGFVLTR